MADQQWKKNLGFLESIMFDPVTSGILGLGEGIMSLFGVSEKNSQIDALKNDYEKMKLTEDQMARRQSDVKRLYGNSVDSMIGAGGLLNGDTAREIAKTKTFMESAKAMLDQRMKDEQTNLGITDKINQLEGQKSGYIPGVMGMLSSGLQGVFGATQASMGMDQKELENDIIKNMFNPSTGTPTGVTNPVTGSEVTIPQVTNTSNATLPPITQRGITEVDFDNKKNKLNLLGLNQLFQNNTQDMFGSQGDLSQTGNQMKNPFAQQFLPLLGSLFGNQTNNMSLSPKKKKSISLWGGV